MPDEINATSQTTIVQPPAVAPAVSATTTPQPAVAAAPAAAQPTATTPAPAASPAPQPRRILATDLPEDALRARLEQAKGTGQTELLRTLGVSSVDELKAAIAAQKAADDAKRTDAEKLALTTKQLETAQTQLAQFEKNSGAIWELESAKLTTEQIAAVTALAGESASARLGILNALRPTWVQAPSATAGTQPVEPAAPVQQQSAPAVPATTSPAPAAPAPAGTTSPTDHKAVWEGLKKTNPIGAANYLAAHQSRIFPTP